MGASGKNRLSLLENEKCVAFCDFGRDFMGFRGKITGDIFDAKFIKKCVFMSQIHSNLVEIYDEKREIYECDGLITNEKNIALCVLSADCLPLILWHKNGFIAALHSGRKGSFENILSEAIKAIKRRDESLKNEDFTLIIAPGICGKNYEISGEILAYARENFGKFLNEKNGLNLKGIIKNQAKNLGIKNVIDTEICTFDDTRFFSYRRDKTASRFVSVVLLK